MRFSPFSIRPITEKERTNNATLLNGHAKRVAATTRAHGQRMKLASQFELHEITMYKRETFKLSLIKVERMDVVGLQAQRNNVDGYKMRSFSSVCVCVIMPIQS